MDVLHDLLEEIYRIQCLAYLGRGAEPTAVGDLLHALRISPGELERVVRALSDDGLLEADRSPEHPLPRSVRLTPDGRERVARWRDRPRAGLTGAAHG